MTTKMVTIRMMWAAEDRPRLPEEFRELVDHEEINFMDILTTDGRSMVQGNMNDDCEGPAVIPWDACFDVNREGDVMIEGFFLPCSPIQANIRIPRAHVHKYIYEMDGRFDDDLLGKLVRMGWNLKIMN